MGNFKLFLPFTVLVPEQQKRLITDKLVEKGYDYFTHLSFFVSDKWLNTEDEVCENIIVTAESKGFIYVFLMVWNNGYFTAVIPRYSEAESKDDTDVEPIQDQF